MGGATTTYQYDGDGLLAIRGGGTGTTNFVWDTSVAPAPLVEAGTDRVVHGLGPLYLARADGSTIRLVRDAVGSVRAEVDDLGLVTKSFRYAAYGAISDSFPSAATPTLLGFTGELADPSGLTYLRARWYDVSSGRFVSKDPFVGVMNEPPTLNGYAYAAARPTMLVDRLGLDPTGASQNEYHLGGIRVVSNAQGFLGFIATVVGGCCHPQSTVTFGSELIVSTGEVPRGSALLAHELGHINQARQLGIWYLPAYVASIPGTVYEHGFNFHDFHPAELNANARAGLLPNGVPPPGWEYP